MNGFLEMLSILFLQSTIAVAGIAQSVRLSVVLCAVVLSFAALLFFFFFPLPPLPSVPVSVEGTNHSLVNRHAQCAG